jgi:hypothetical protein
VREDYAAGQVRATGAYRTIECRGAGESLVAAYAALTQVRPEPLLSSAFEQLLDA